MQATFKERVAALVRRIDSDPVRDFFMGPVYPVIVSLIVLIGHLTTLEYYFNIANVLLASLALCVIRTAKPMIVFVCTYVFQVTVKHAPGVPTYTDYYFSGWRLWLVVVLAVILFSSFGVFIVRNRLYRALNFRDTKLLLPMLVFSLALLLNGAFSDKWCIESFAYGFFVALAYNFIYLFFYLGLRGEEPRGLTDYFVYSTALIALVLIGQLAGLYLTSPNIIKDGSIVKDAVLFGWGVWNTMGISLTVLIPVLFIGVIKGKHPWLYFLLATLTMLCTVLTLSRGTTLFGGIFYCVSVVICAFFSKEKKKFRIITLLGIIAVIAVCVLFYDKISTLVLDFINRGFSDNGRYELWQTGIDNFLSSPVLGVGFFGFVGHTFIAAAFLPDMAHQTVIQILSSMGVIGLLAYGFYRIATLVPFFKKPCIEKTMILMSVLVLLTASMLDNYIFYFIPTFHYSVSLAIGSVYRDRDEEIKISND